MNFRRVSEQNSVSFTVSVSSQYDMCVHKVFYDISGQDELIENSRREIRPV